MVVPPASRAPPERFGWAAAAICLAVSLCAGAAPNLPLEDPAWDELRDAIDEGRIADPLGGVQSLGEDHVFELLGRHPALPQAAWASPFHRAIFRTGAADEHDRPYSLPLRPRQVAGDVALSCEYQEGRPCGDGSGLGGELDSAAGFGTWVTAATRVRWMGGTGGYSVDPLALDRAYLKLEVGPLLFQVGRDALALGPSTRGLMVSEQAVPQDGIRAQLHPVALPFAPEVRLSLFYFLDRLRPPQRFTGTLLDGARAQLDFGNRFQLGGSRLLQLGGQGAPPFGGLEGFVLEHFGREDGGDAENNRLSFDASLHIPELRSARLYYELALEDTRKKIFNSLQYDADHLVGIEVRALWLGRLRRVFAEFQHTGWVSQEHGVFTTGMTNGGRTFGSPLGPDATSVWVRGDIDLGNFLVSPWTEWIRFISDAYGSDEARGVFVTSVGPMEHRERVGADVQAQLSARWALLASVFGERVGNVDLVIGATRINAGFRAALTFTP